MARVWVSPDGVAVQGTGFRQAVDPNGMVIWETAGTISIWTGTKWIKKPMKVWNGTAWVIKPVKRWTGTEWVLT